MISDPIDAARERYVTLIDATLRHALRHRAAWDGPANSMEHALPALARRLGLTGDDDDAALRAARGAIASTPLDVGIVDGAGNTRGVYRPLLMRALAPVAGGDVWAAYRRSRRVDVRAFADDDGAQLVAFDGATIVARLFEALAIDAIASAVGEADACVADAFARVVAGQAADGTFLVRTSADQLEPAWYHELAVLHAVRAYAEASGGDAAAAFAAAARSARYHAEQVQPDHASSHPFGLAALLDDAEGIHLADMMLHSAGVQQPARMDAVSLVLLLDALDCGRRAKPR